jgi:hypothetical protein
MHIVHPPRVRPTNGAPQTVAVAFWALLYFMLPFPFAQVALDGATDPRMLITLIKTEGGFNIFAVLLLLAPLVGILWETLASSLWRVGGFIIAAAAAMMVPLTLMTADRQLQRAAAGQNISVTPGIGGYILLLAYSIIAITAGVAAFRHVRAYSRTLHDAEGHPVGH